MDERAVGVVVGRFQVPSLHIGHQRLLHHVAMRHATVLVLVGTVSTPPTERNPLPFELREHMLKQHFAHFYPDVSVVVIKLPSRRGEYPKRSMHIDTIIRDMFPGQPAILYGSRDSIIHRYTGAFQTEEFAAINSPSATEVRAAIVPLDSLDFRAGYIDAIKGLWPRVYPAVDIAVQVESGEFVLGRKPDETLFRFPGGFVDPGDASLEDASFREAGEELPRTEVNRASLRLVGSHRVNDWRYRGTKDGIMTSLVYGHGTVHELVAGDDIAEIRLFRREEMEAHMTPEHLPLLEILLKYMYARSLIAA